MRFPDEFIKEIIEDYKADYGITLTDEEANRYLNAYASFGSIIFDLLSSSENLSSDGSNETSGMAQPCEDPPAPCEHTTADAVVSWGRGGRSRASSLAVPLNEKHPLWEAR